MSLRIVLRQLGVIIITLMHLVVARPDAMHSVATISSMVRAVDDNESLSRSFHAIMIACCTCAQTIDGRARVINRSMREKINQWLVPFYMFITAHLHRDYCTPLSRCTFRSIDRSAMSDRMRLNLFLRSRRNEKFLYTIISRALSREYALGIFG